MPKTGLTPFIERDIFNDIAGHLSKPEMTLITGSRQVGKTVLMEQLREHLIKKKKISPDSIFFYNLDIIKDWEVFQSQEDFIDLLKDRSRKKKIFVFVDEAQRVPEAARFFKGVYDSKINAKLILTGSSSLEIKSKLKETLAGRKRIFLVQPFTFAEFLRAKEKKLAEYLSAGKKLITHDEKKILSLYKEYIIFGGYPRAVLSESREEKKIILNEIYSSYVEKDAIGFLEVKNKNAFNRLLRLLSAQSGQLVKVGELATNLGIDRSTVDKYISVLEETFIIKKIRPYFNNPRQEIVKAGKIYFMDMGIRNLLLDNFSSFENRHDKGEVLENSVFIELFSRLKHQIGEIHFWRTKQGAEVDFIIERGLELLPVEVKTAVKKESIPTGLRSFTDKFSPKKAILINLSIPQKTISLNNTKVDFLYPFSIDKALQKK